MVADRNRLCPVERANSLDSAVRKWLQNPVRILAPYVREGTTVLDVGCGPGFFSIALARLVGVGGRVIAADLQQGMLDKLGDKTRGTELEERVKLVRCDKESVNVSEPVDFILAFYMVHEVPDKESFFRQLHTILTKNGQILLVEPKLFHVSRKDFTLTISIARRHGFELSPGPPLLASWTAILKKQPEGA